MPDTNPFRFDYKKYKTKSINVDTLDKIFEVVISPSVSMLDKIFKGIQLALVTWYLLARKSLIEQQLEIEKQEYETGRTNTNIDDINRDDLD